jgi:hypothetical protein
MQRALVAMLGHERARLFEEVGEFGRAHLARGHGEVAMMNRAEAAEVALDGNVVRRVREDHRRPLVRQQRRIGLLV